MNRSKTFDLVNPLTIHEQLQVTRLLGHDSNSSLIIAYNIAELASVGGDTKRMNELQHHINHSNQINQTVEILTQNTMFPLFSKNALYFFDPFTANEFAQCLDTVVGKINVTTNSAFDGFLTVNPILYAAIYNLAKNGYEASRKNEIKLSVETLDYIPTDILHVPISARDHNKFTRLSMHSQSLFETDKPLRELGQMPPAQGEHGFGLYFVNLASKVLQAPWDIQSDSKNGTTISIYHPHYVA